MDQRSLEWQNFGTSVLEITRAEAAEAKRQLMLVTGRNQDLRCAVETAQRERWEAIADLALVIEGVDASKLNDIESGLSRRCQKHLDAMQMHRSRALRLDH